MPLPRDIAARLREVQDEVERRRLRDDLSRAVVKMALKEMKRTCRARDITGGDFEDASQELVIKLVVAIEDSDRAPRAGEEDSYIKRSARNAALDILVGKGIYRYRVYETPPASEAGFGSKGDYEDAQQWLEEQHRNGELRAAVDQLKAGQREVVLALHFEGMDVPALAQVWLDAGRAEDLTKARQNIYAAHSRGLQRLGVLLTRQREQAEEVDA